MKKIGVSHSVVGLALIALLCCASLLLSASTVRAQCGGVGQGYPNTNNSGEEFLLCFEQNATLADTDPGYLDIFMASIADSTDITVTCKAFPQFVKHLSLKPGGSISYRVSNDIDPTLLSSETVESKVVRVVATKAIVCYGMNHKQYTADAFLALPRNTATTDYRVMSYTNTPGAGPGDETQAQFVVAAFSDGTDVTITPAGQTRSGSVAGKPLHFRLDSGTCVQIQGDALRSGEDMTGSSITSTKPVVVFAGHVCAEVPVGYAPPGAASSSCDHLCEMMPPTSTWGESFVATNFLPRQGGDIVRVQALNDNTLISINGQPWGSALKSGQFRDTMIIQPIAISTTQPVQVGEFAHTAFDQSSTNGDPFFAIVPPLNQTYNDFTFFASEDPVYTQQALIIVAEISAKGTISMDGQLIPATSFTDIATPLNGSSYSLAVVAVTPGPHHIYSNTTIEKGFTILSYAFGSFDSYGYTAGALLKPLRGVGLKPSDPAGIIDHSKRETILNLSNILSTRVYLDSASVEVIGANALTHTASVRENVWRDISYLEMGEKTTLHLDLNPLSSTPVPVHVRFYSHSAQWYDFAPSEIYTTIAPQAMSGVGTTNTLAQHITLFPNPVRDRATLALSVPEHSDIQLLIYDDLGRVVREVVNQEMAAGSYPLRIEASELAAGHYTYVLRSEKLGWNERGSLVITR